MSDRRLIEEYLPVSAVSYEATREKVLRRRDYHISTLHQWWARRPLAAARAAVYAALVPAPTRLDGELLASFFASLCAWGGSASTISEARREILEAANGEPPKVLDTLDKGRQRRDMLVEICGLERRVRDLLGDRCQRGGIECHGPRSLASGQRTIARSRFSTACRML